MCINLFHIYILTRIVGESCRDDSVKEGSGDAEGPVGGEDGEGLDVQVVGLLLWW